MIHPLPFVWPYAVVFWVVFIWAFAPESGLVKRATKVDRQDDAGSMTVILIGNQGAMLFGFVAAWFIPTATFSNHRVAAFWVGTALLAGGAILRRHCFRTLGQFFCGAVIVRADHQVIDQGAYRWVRHPSYTAGIAIFTGMAIALGNWISVLLMVAIPIAVYSYRVVVEERALLLRLGDPYRLYAERRKRFIPFII